jgi:RNA polymerase sigma-70 factor, ECF subfamily
MASQQELTDARNARFMNLLKPVMPDCERFAYSLTLNVPDAQDIVSQAIVSGLQNLHQLKNDGAFKTWMFRIINNHFRMLIRGRKREADPVDPEELPRQKQSGDSFVERDERRTVVSQALAKLSPDQRQALVLFEVEGLSIRETSEVLGKSEVAIRVTLTRARERLKTLLKVHGISPVLGSEERGTDIDAS